MWFLVAVGVLAVLLYRMRAVPLKTTVPLTSVYLPFVGTTWSLIYEFVWRKELSGGEYEVRELDNNGWKPYAWAHFGGLSGVFIVDPKDIKHLLLDRFHDFEKDLSDKFEELLGTGIFVSNGAQWKQQRVTASHMFNRRKLRERMSDVFGVHAVALCNEIAKHADTDMPFDIQKHFYKYTFDCINEVAFDRKKSPADAAFQAAFDHIQKEIPTRFFLPWWRLTRMLNIGSERIISENMKIVDKYIGDVLQDYEDRGIRANDSTMTGLFMEDAKETGNSVCLRDVLLNFMLAGRDTTGSALTSSVYYLSLNEECQEKLHAEAAQVFNGSSEALTFDDIDEKSPYSTAVVLEALRLHPSVPENEKMTVNDVVFPSGTVVPKGANVTWSPYVTNRHPDYWPDPNTYKPERWMSGDLPDDYTYNTFNAGPRLCLGKNMALLEAKVALLTLAEKYSFRLKKGFTPKPLITITYQLGEGGLQVHAERRI
eukprot:TRINITY_DN2030_c1_g1_i1.p1 TRINITY_DN2030_c1_g1~~TRINITY_DN2030_c1_g1_i1.p1  ORF type:complete len:498 (+),score=128.49 TRINITY_DN2030_c1_g1_i1:48-1496(+)